MNYYPQPTPERTAILGGAQRIDHNPTVEENLDERIRYLESELQRLKESKESLGPLLKMKIRDIRQAMDY
jgi:hypothetical protein